MDTVDTASGLAPDYLRTREGKRGKVELQIPQPLERLNPAHLLTAGAWLLAVYTRRQNVSFAVETVDGKGLIHAKLDEVSSSKLADRLIDMIQPDQLEPIDTAAFGGLVVRLDDMASPAWGDVCVSLSQDSESSRLTVDYRSDVYREDVVRNYAEHLQRLLEWLSVAGNDDPARCNLISESEQEVLLNVFNSAKAAFPVDQTLPGLFSRQVEAGPERVAVRADGGELTYQQLDEVSNQIANTLLELGISGGEFVALLDDRTIDFPAAILGIMKSGGAYVPVDPSYPEGRVQYMIKDCRARVIISRSRHLEKLTGKGILDNLEAVICLDNPDSSIEGLKLISRSELEAAKASAPEATISAGDFAYMIYTSGSTGQPKGAINRHDGVINHMYAEFELCDFHGDSAFLQSAPSSFDISVWQFLAPLVLGGKTVIVPRETVLDPARLWSVIIEEGITVMELVPSVYKLLLDHEASLSEEERARLRLDCAMVTGEAVPVQVVNRWFELFPRIPMANLYGPTEASDDICQAILTGPVDERQVSVTIGSPLTNLHVYILDDDLQLLPLGVPGEICVSGIGVGAGYWNKPEKTAAAFTSNPYHQGFRGEILYRTGDLGRWLPDGTIDFLGRLDHLVKIRGMRIELGEVEAAMVELPEVKDAVAVARATDGDGKELAAYYILHPGEKLPPQELRSRLEGSLPQNHIPAAAMQLREFPLTPNGKVDRNALPAIEQQGSDGRWMPGEEVNAIETGVAGAWQEILTHASFGLDQSFFDVGGNSLMVAMVLSQISERFDVDLSIRTFIEQPTVRAIAARVEQEVELGHGAERLAGLPREQTSEYPLSFSQERLWFIDRMSPGSTIYNMSYQVRIEGGIDPQRFAEAFAQLQRRHEMLRTVYVDSADGPMQRVLPEPLVQLKTVDISDLEDGEARLEKMTSDLAAISIDLEQGPLLAGQLVKVKDERFLFQLVIHHISCDGMSVTRLLYELGEIYDALVHGSRPDLPDLPATYGQYARWQWECVPEQLYENQLAYWKKTLGDAPPLLELPYDFRRPAEQDFRGETLDFEFDESLTSRLREFASSLGTTLYPVFHAAFATVLHKYSRQNDIVVGAPVSHRPFRELEHVAGMFINNCVLRIDLNAAQTVRELIKQCRDSMFSGLENLDVPFERIVRELHPQRSLSYNPLFQVFLGLEPVPDEQFSPEGVRAEIHETAAGTSRFDLSCFLFEFDEHIGGRLEFSTNLFRRSTIERFLQHFRSVLELLPESAELNPREIDLLAEDEREKILTTWNDTDRQFDLLPLHELFEQRVREQPEAVALEFATERLSYAGLNAMANRIAAQLMSRDVKPGSLVGLYHSRKPVLVAAMLGILKAGCAYLPLDPSYPPGRVAFMLEDSQAPLVLTEKELTVNLAGAKTRIVLLESMLENDSDGEADLHVETSLSDLAYSIYTSGSTGKPKGVQIEHGAAANFILSMAGKPGFSRDDSVLALTTICFDISVLELFLPLATGGRIVLLTREEAVSGRKIAEALSQHDVTMLQVTPVTWKLLLDSGWSGKQNLKMLCGGEAMSEQLADALITRGSELWNVYGPTETTVWCTTLKVNDCEADSRAYQGSINIGAPIDNMRIFILDDEGLPTPIGVPGELYIGGKGLARGYCGRPQLNSERFISRVVDGLEHRLYRTGDLARWREDGNIDFIGRADNQVKIRGYRIELGEIEAVIARHDAVKDVVVIIREDHPGDKQLVAYYRSDDEAPIASSSFRALSQERLPEYMIPSAFVWMREFPLTPNKKIDRRSLPAPDQEGSAGDIREPRSETERALAGIWESVLNAGAVGIDQNFFELGGHSLNLINALTQIEQKLGKQLKMRDFFQHPTIEELAKIVDGELLPGQLKPLQPVQVNGHRSPVFFVGVDNRANVLSRHLGEDQPLYKLDILAYEKEKGMHNTISVEKIARRFILEMKKVQPVGPYIMGGFCRNSLIAYEMAQQLIADGEEVAMLAVFDYWQHQDSTNWFLRQYENLKDFGWRYIYRKLRLKWIRFTDWLERKIGSQMSNREEYESERPENRNYILAIEHAFDRYQCQPISARVALFITSELAALPSPDWDRLADEDKRSLDIIEGLHMNLFSPGRVELLAERMKERLDECDPAVKKQG